MRACWVIALIGLASCATPPTRPRDELLERFAKLARTEFDRGAYERAERFYRQALDRARAADDAMEIANLSHNLAACCAALGRHDEALSLLEDARAELARARLPAGEVALMQATVARRAGRSADALKYLEEARAAAESDPRLRPRAAILEAELACDAHDAPAAKQALSKISKRERKTLEPRLAARWETAQARWHLLEDRPREAALAFERAAEELRRAGAMGRELAAPLDSAAEAWHRAGRAAEAAENHLRSARVLMGAGLWREAAERMELALTAAQESRSEEVLRRVERLALDLGRRFAEGVAP